MTTHTAASLAKRLGGRLVGPADLPVTGVNSLEAAQPNDVTFITDSGFARRWVTCKASVALVSAGIDVRNHDHSRRALIVVPDAEQAMADLLLLFAPADWTPSRGVHPTAVIEPGVTLGPDVAIGPTATVQAGARLGPGVVLHAGVRIYRDVEIGEDSVLHANVVVRDRCVLGKRVVLNSGVAIGTDGFGYRSTQDGRGLRKITHVGNVIIEDDVEIGANTCVDRGKFGATVIGWGTKIDNLVQIGHNCRIGRCCVIAALAGLSGSVTVGDGAQIGGGAGVADHVTIEAEARLAGHAGVISTIAAGEKVFGLPAQPIREALRQAALLRRLRVWMDEVSARLERLERTGR